MILYKSIDKGCPTFLLVRATFTEEKLLRATCIFAKIKVQIFASLLYEIGAHFGQYFGYLSKSKWRPKKKRSSPQIGAYFRQYFEYLSQKVSEDQKIGLRRKSELISEKPNRRRFWFRPFYLPENAK